MPSLSFRTSSETYSEQSVSPCLAHKSIGQCRDSSPHNVLRKSTPTSVSPTFSGLQWQRFMLFHTVFSLQAILRVHQLSRKLLIVYLQTFLQTLFTFHSQETTYLLQVQMKRAGHGTRVSSHWIVTRDGFILRALQRFQVQHSMWTLVENIILREVMGEVGVSYVFKWNSLTQLPQSIFPQVQDRGAKELVKPLLAWWNKKVNSSKLNSSRPSAPGVSVSVISNSEDLWGQLGKFYWLLLYLTLLEFLLFHLLARNWKCSRVQIAQELCKVIESADPRKCPKGHDVCKMAASFYALILSTLPVEVVSGALPLLSSGAT
ncbi:hypothetical protein Pmani_021183 [Petrolisthes manimaculis]|uniref:Uncharacterized protein n=1 Tax=Petrolisthes manimaculis TaxID=1843537 RepID=A0AAE1PFD8_9EUCA|nr:hypothetical protein Pmani_021183 [Petrolisthes manimaculis]